MTQQKYRFTVDVSEGLADEISKISEQTGKSKAEVFRSAIELLSRARAARRAGMHVGAWDDTAEGKRVEREFMING
jgi:predicted transcriptional regulator